MNTILEDRLRSHFAEQAARDVLEEPDPRTVMARAPAAPAPRPSPGRGRPGRRGRALRLTVVGLAAACLLAVVAVVATRDDGGKVDVTEHPTTTTTVRDATTSTTVPETTTTTVAVVGPPPPGRWWWPRSGCSAGGTAATGSRPRRTWRCPSRAASSTRSPGSAARAPP